MGFCKKYIPEKTRDWRCITLIDLVGCPWRLAYYMAFQMKRGTGPDTMYHTYQAISKVIIWALHRVCCLFPPSSISLQLLLAHVSAYGSLTEAASLLRRCQCHLSRLPTSEPSAFGMAISWLRQNHPRSDGGWSRSSWPRKSAGWTASRCCKSLTSSCWKVSPQPAVPLADSQDYFTT